MKRVDGSIVLLKFRNKHSMRTHGPFDRLFVLSVRYDIPLFKLKHIQSRFGPILHIPLVLFMPEFVISTRLLSTTSARHQTIYQNARSSSPQQACPVRVGRDRYLSGQITFSKKLCAFWWFLIHAGVSTEMIYLL